MWSNEWDKVFKALNQKVISVKELTKYTDISYRMVNDWDARGIFDAERKTSRGWRKFSIVDIIRLSIIKKLKDFGLPLYRLKGILKWLEYNPAVEFSIYQVTNNINSYLYTNLEDECGIYSDEELLKFIKISKEQEHLSIILPINKIIKNVLLSIKTLSLEVKIISDKYWFKVDNEWISP
jgi:DNA-binding transcriptional MerR regulator